MTARRAGRRPAQPNWRESFVEELGVLAGDAGLPRAVARVLAWMVVCKPAEHSANDIQATPTLSAGAMSAATRMLVAAQLLERTARPGDRRTHYRLRPGGWEGALEARSERQYSCARLPIVLCTPRNGRADDRLREMREVNAWFEDKLDEPLAERRSGR